MDKQTIEEKLARKQKLVEVALASYITAHCGDLKHKSTSVVGKILVDFASAAYAAESDELPELAAQFSVKSLNKDMFNEV
jgi:hypothetical protein